MSDYFEYTPENMKKILLKQPWLEMQKHFDNLPKHDPTVVSNVDITSQDWIEFALKNYHLADHSWEIAKPHYSDFEKTLVQTNIDVGRNKHNTYEISFGKQQNSNEMLIELLGYKNFAKMHMKTDHVQMRFLIKMPGQGVAWHVDGINSFQLMYPHLKYDKNFINNGMTDQGRVVRYWFSVTDWQDGHIFQISKTLLWNYKQGQVYHIPTGLGHCSGNAGYIPQYSVAVTGIVDK